MTKCHQKIIRERNEKDAAKNNLFGAWWDEIDTEISRSTVKQIDYNTAKAVILDYEWLGNMGTTEYAYGIYFSGSLGGVVCFGRTAGTNVYRSIFGDPFGERIITLCRGACVHWAHPHSASKLISTACRMMGEHGYWAFIAYSDPSAGEIGTVYQACGWRYCGMTTPSEQFETPSGEIKDARLVHAYTRDRTNGTLKYKRTRSQQKQLMIKYGYKFFKGNPKHKYVGIYSDKGTRRQLIRCFRLPALPYPKRAPEASITDALCHTSTEGEVRSLDGASFQK